MTDEIPRKERKIPEHKIREVVETLREQADDIDSDSVYAEGHASGVMAGIRHSVDELEALLK